MGARWAWTLVLAMLLASSAGAETRDERLQACAGLGGKTPEARIKACSAAIAASAPVAGWLFGRDVAKTRLGDRTGGSADIAAAERLEPDITIRALRGEDERMRRARLASVRPSTRRPKSGGARGGRVYCLQINAPHP